MTRSMRWWVGKVEERKEKFHFPRTFLFATITTYTGSKSWLVIFGQCSSGLEFRDNVLGDTIGIIQWILFLIRFKVEIKLHKLT